MGRRGHSAPLHCTVPWQTLTRPAMPLAQGLPTVTRARAGSPQPEGLCGEGARLHRVEGLPWGSWNVAPPSPQLMADSPAHSAGTPAAPVRAGAARGHSLVLGFEGP